MGKEITGILSDNRDYKLLGLVNDVLDRRDSFQYLRNVLYPHLGPRGIKELAASAWHRREKIRKGSFFLP